MLFFRRMQFCNLRCVLRLPTKYYFLLRTLDGRSLNYIWRCLKLFFRRTFILLRPTFAIQQLQLASSHVARETLIVPVVFLYSQYSNIWFLCRYLTSGTLASFLYRIVISAPSMTTRGVRRPHIMLPRNIRDQSPCYTRWTVCRRSAWRDCLRTRLWRLSGWRRRVCETHLWIEFDANSDESIQRGSGPICTALHVI